MSAKTYQQLLQELADEAGPDPAAYVRLHEQAREILDEMSADLSRFAFKTEDVARELLATLFAEKYGQNQTRVVKGKPGPKTIRLAYATIGKAPGLYEVWVIWTPLGVDVYFAQVETGNLRDSELPEADIVA